MVSEVLDGLPFGFGSYRNAVCALRKAGLIETTRHGGNGRRAEYRLATSLAWKLCHATMTQLVKLCHATMTQLVKLCHARKPCTNWARPASANVVPHLSHLSLRPVSIWYPRLRRPDSLKP